MSNPHARAIAEALTTSGITGNSALHAGMRAAEITRGADLLSALSDTTGLDLEKLARTVTSTSDLSQLLNETNAA